MHYYLSRWVVGISTVGALLALYFTFIQTVSGIPGALAYFKKNSKFRSLSKYAFLLPFLDAPSSEVTETKSGCDFDCDSFCKDLRELCMEICLAE